MESSSLHQKAVLWTFSSYDNQGEAKVSAATEIDVRWEESVRETLDPKGNVIAADATVVVDRDIANHSIMWLGAEDDLASPPVDLYQVISFSKIPDVKGRNFRRVVLLMKYSDELPELA